MAEEIGEVNQIILPETLYTKLFRGINLLHIFNFNNSFSQFHQKHFWFIFSKSTYGRLYLVYIPRYKCDILISLAPLSEEREKSYLRLLKS